MRATGARKRDECFAIGAGRGDQRAAGLICLLNIVDSTVVVAVCSVEQSD